MNSGSTFNAIPSNVTNDLIINEKLLERNEISLQELEVYKAKENENDENYMVIKTPI